MVALVSVETVLLVLVLVLVAGLLRSHAELLRRIGPPDQPAAAGPEGSPAIAPPPPPGQPAAGSGGARTGAAAPVVGTTPHGDSVVLDFERVDGLDETAAVGEAASAPTLLAFLTSGCSTCAGFWSALAERAIPGVQPVIVTRGSERERPARLRALAPDGVPVVMSSAAWEHYGVPGAPYFVLVEETIRGEGVASTWAALSSLVADAIADAREAEPAGQGSRRARDVDATLAAAGIMPGDPRLYPGRAPAP